MAGKEVMQDRKCREILSIKASRVSGFHFSDFR